MASRRRRPRPQRRAWRLRTALLGLFLAASLAGCVSMPSGGPVLSYPITQGPSGQSQPYLQAIAQPPQANWGPEDMVRGFLTASASFARQEIAREYLTAKENRAWNPRWSAVVYSNGPDIGPAVFSGTGSKRTATVTIGGKEQATLSGYGGYAVPSTSAGGGSVGGPQTFTLQQVGGRWRISGAPSKLLLTSYQFQADYQPRNLYFFDSTDSFLVPDPVYVPSQGTTAQLMDGLVHDLINPPRDWLTRGATNTSFPASTTPIGDVTVTAGTAAVNLGGGIAKAGTRIRQEVSAQLLWTLIGSGGSGPAVQSMELSVNGKPWPPPNSDLNPVQQLHQSAFSPAIGASGTYYYVDGAGNLLSSGGPEGKPHKLSHIGTGYSQIAVSPDKHYLAAVNNGSLFIGRIGGPLAKRGGSAYTSVSWDPTNNLWATQGDQIVMVRGTANPAQPAGQPIPVDVVDSDGMTPNTGQFTALRVAPDGARMAIIVGTADLYFGAIVFTQSGGRPSPLTIEVMLSPFSVSEPGATFTSLAWYGADNVITLRNPGTNPNLTEYPADGGSSTSIPSQPGTSWITASWGSALLAGLPGGEMYADASLSGSWTKAQAAISAVYPG